MAVKKPKHDPFFSRSLEIPVIAQAFFKQHIPPYVAEQLDLSNVIRIDRLHTDKNLKKRERDIIYQALINQKDDAFLCIEHQSQYQPNIPLRLLQYHTDTTHMYLNAGNTKWPVVITWLLYHGQTSPYPYASESTAYYQNPLIGNKQLAFRFYVVDLTQLSDEKILTHGLCAPMELLLKHGRDAKFELDVAAYRPVFNACIKQVGEDYLYTMLDYVTTLDNLQISKKIYNFIETIFENKKTLIMTYRQKLIQEGKQEGVQMGIQLGKQEGVQMGIQLGKQEGIQLGKQEGIQLGKQEGIQARNMALAKIMLKDGEAIEKIMRWTQLSKEAIEKISKNMD